MATRTRKRTWHGKKAQPNRYVFTTEDCKKGYRAALEKCSHDIEKFAWLFRRYVA